MIDTRKKKKMGRPKKRGPKKKRKSRAKPKPKIVKPRLSWNWKIVIVSNGKQVGYVGKYLTIKEAYASFEKCKEENKSVIFESKLKNSGTIQERKDEYILLEKNVDNKPSTLLRNEYGEFVENISSNKKWLILEKTEKKTEEEFWVYGYNPRTQRKKFQWIYDNIILVGLEEKWDYKRIIVFKNKLIILADDNTFNMVICKTIGDCIRFYNKLEELSGKKSNLIFCGNYSHISEKREVLIQQIADLTGWSKRKICLKSTRS